MASILMIKKDGYLDVKEPVYINSATPQLALVVAFSRQPVCELKRLGR
jgi:hypothetical protein